MLGSGILPREQKRADLPGAVEEEKDLYLEMTGPIQKEKL